MGIEKVTIKQGDTLYKIANEYGTTVDNIVSLNRDTIKDPNLIIAGNTINVQRIEEVELTPNSVSFEPESNLKSSDMGLSFDSTKTIDSVDEDVIDNNETVMDTTVELNENVIEPVEETINTDSNDSEIILDSNEEINVNNIVNYEDELRNTYSSILNKDYKHQCGVLTRNQLELQGIVYEGVTGIEGKRYASNLFENRQDFLKDGYYAIGYSCDSSNQKSVFDNLVNENNGNLSNLVISFNTGGSFPSDFGHVMLVSKISDGNVYFMDNFDSGWGVKTKNLNVMPIEQFRDNYLKDANNANFMTQIRKR